MKISEIIYKSIAAGFGWTIGKNVANRGIGSGCITIIMLFMFAAIAKIISTLL